MNIAVITIAKLTFCVKHCSSVHVQVRANCIVHKSYGAKVLLVDLLDCCIYLVFESFLDGLDSFRFG